MTPAQPRVPWQAKYVTLTLVWGSSFLLMMVALRAFTPWQIASVRVALAAATLLALLAATRGRLPRDPRVWAHLTVCGFFLAALPFTCFVWAETRIPSALAGIANSTTPIASVVAVALLLPSQPVRRRQVLGVLAGFLGVVLVAHPWDVVGRPDPLGLGVALVGGLSYGVGWTYNRRHLAGADLGGLSQPAALMVTGSVLMVPVALVTWLAGRPEQPWPWSPVPGAGSGGTPLWLSVVCVVVLAVVNTGVAYMLNYDIVRAVGPVKNSTMTYFIPIVSVLLGVLVLREHLAWVQLVGFGVVLAAAWTINRSPRVGSAS